MNQDCADANDLRGQDSAQDSIPKQSGTHALTVKILIDCQAP
jgi:hypothetical protein